MVAEAGFEPATFSRSWIVMSTLQNLNIQVSEISRSAHFLAIF